MANKPFPDKILGTALDIGTTEIKGSLLDIRSKKELASAAVWNEQKSFGRDVITRLHLATANKAGLGELNKKVISSINKLLNELVRKARTDKNRIHKIVAVGNSVMHHLVFMISPASLARAPFQPAEKKMREKNARKMGINAAKDARFKFLPNIGGFVGSDTLAAILATGINKNKKYSILIDIGTNGEIVIGSQKKILVTSCACGPAFEARRRCPGSKVIDIVSTLLNKGVIDKTGRMAPGRKTYLTQQDVREIQVAKAALRAGLEVLRTKLGLDIKNIRRLYITGRFGTSINIRNAKNIGLIPPGIPNNKIIILKNGALLGAKEVLLEPKREKAIDNILAKCKHIELHKDSSFQDLFAAAMAF